MNIMACPRILQGRHEPDAPTEHNTHTSPEDGTPPMGGPVDWHRPTGIVSLRAGGWGRARIGHGTAPRIRPCCDPIGVLAWYLYTSSANVLSVTLQEMVMARAEKRPMFALFLYYFLVSFQEVSGLLTTEQAMRLLYYPDLTGFLANESYSKLLFQIINEVLPGLLIRFVLYSSFLSVFIPALFVRKEGKIDIGKLEDWHLPRAHQIAVAATYVIGVILVMASEGATFVFGYMIYTLSSYYLRIEGISFLSYFGKIMIEKESARNIICVVLFCLLGDLMTMIGLMVIIFDLRNRIIIKKRTL